MSEYQKELQVLSVTGMILVALICAAGTVWTAYWSVRFGLTPRPPLSTFETVVRFSAVALALLLSVVRSNPLERATYLCAVVAAGASALFGLGMRSATIDVARLLFHFLGYALGALVSMRWLAEKWRASESQE